MNKINELVKLAGKAGADAWECKKVSGETHVIRAGSFERYGPGITTYSPVAEEMRDVKVAKFIAAPII